MSKRQKNQRQPANLPAAGTELREQLQAAIANGEVPQPVPATVTSAPAQSAAKTTTTDTPVPVEVASGRAGKREYDSFFDLYAKVVREGGNRCSILDGPNGKKNGSYFLPLGFIPGPAVLLLFWGGEPQYVDGTPDVKGRADDPAVLEKIGRAMDAWQTLVQGIGQEPSPWNMGFARRVLEGQVPPRYLAMGMTKFRLGPGEAEVPFGVTLVPADEKAVKVGKIYNPAKMAGVPTEGEVLSLAVLKDGKGPVQKMIRTWALMESNFLSRYYRDGNPRNRR